MVGSELVRFVPLDLVIGRDNARTLRRGELETVHNTLNLLGETVGSRVYARALDQVADRFIVPDGVQDDRKQDDLLVMGPMILKGAHILRTKLREEGLPRSKAKLILGRAETLERDIITVLSKLWKSGDADSQQKVLDFVDEVSEPDHPAYPSIRPFLNTLLRDTRADVGEVATESLVAVARYCTTREDISEYPRLEHTREESFTDWLLRQEPRELLHRAGENTEDKERIREAMLALEQARDPRYGTWERIMDNDLFLAENSDAWEELLVGELGEVALPDRPEDRGHIVRALSAVYSDDTSALDFLVRISAFAENMRVADEVREVVQEVFEGESESREAMDRRRVCVPPHSPFSSGALAQTALSEMDRSEVDTALQLILGNYIGVQKWEEYWQPHLSESSSEADLALKVQEMITVGAETMVHDLGLVDLANTPREDWETTTREALAGVIGEDLISRAVRKYILAQQLAEVG